MTNPGKHAAAERCADFLDELATPSFIVFGYKKPDGSIEVIQSVKDLHPMEYAKAMSWAQNEILENL